MDFWVWLVMIDLSRHFWVKTIAASLSFIFHKKWPQFHPVWTIAERLLSVLAYLSGTWRKFPWMPRQTFSAVCSICLLHCKFTDFCKVHVWKINRTVPQGHWLTHTLSFSVTAEEISADGILEQTFTPSHPDTFLRPQEIQMQFLCLLHFSFCQEV